MTFGSLARIPKRKTGSLASSIILARRTIDGWGAGPWRGASNALAENGPVVDCLLLMMSSGRSRTATPWGCEAAIRKALSNSSATWSSCWMPQAIFAMGWSTSMTRKD